MGGKRSHQLHDRTDGPRNVHSMVTVNRDDAGGAAQRRETNESRVIIHYGHNIIGTVRYEPVQFTGLKDRILRGELF